MARLIVATGMGEPEFSSNKGLIYAFRALGHEVIRCGPPYWDRGHDAEIVFDDRDFPESYSYEEVLARAPWQPDLILQCEPHFYFHGPKPPEITSAYYFTDPHRGGAMWHKMAIQGNFDHVFVGQKYFLPLFLDLPTKVHYLPVGFDERRFPQEDPYWQEEPECEVAFVGQTGLADMEYPYEDDVGKFATTTPNIWDHKKFAFGFHPGFDYAERGELIYRLCREFNVRIYSGIWDTPNYFRALRKGAIGFHRSLLKDVSIRCLEILASGRFLITDSVPYQEELFQDGIHCRTYLTWYKPFFDNYTLEYRMVSNHIKNYLNNYELRETVASRGCYIVRNYHTWRHRAEQLLSIVFS